ncbi:hypothetical protein TNCV_1863681 [Trichonephila clavipes]|nr:hypothetical protein TNCV_1863681 [Trichonephila clavipes]
MVRPDGMTHYPVGKHHLYRGYCCHKEVYVVHNGVRLDRCITRCPGLQFLFKNSRTSYNTFADVTIIAV